ncbi:MAG: isoleucine--tRNA ligase, partial [Acidimicrobiia bacterium]|nr:isoleucine--tRNA ligase [Acidimicrobiia bacterium]
MTQPQKGFTRVAPNLDLPAVDARILELWDRIDAFKTQVEMRPVEKGYVFYDGPPFANGSPHYGHILAGIIKDVVPRYWAMRGYRVQRTFGWDTHGLPVEMEVEKALGISGPRQIAEYGIGRFNEACRALVETTADEWQIMVRRVGRWVDMENDYKTMDPAFMESVWWVFDQLWQKDLIYLDFKVLPYSWGATTPLSNFEANLDYRDTEDPSITVKLEVVEPHGAVEAGDFLLIWTTTPWTLPGNLAVAAGEDIEYVRITEGSQRFWVAAERVAPYWSDDPAPDATISGSDLAGVGYLPPFDYFGTERDRGAFRVILSDDVTTEDGTGLVHMAPAYGEADFFALQAAGLDVLVDPVDAEGRFTADVPDVAGMNIKDADDVLLRLLEEQGILVTSERITHSYPFCYRTGTPLIYKAIPTWFVRVEDFKDRMVTHNNAIHWVPEYVGQRRFGNWLEGARDWAISRNRYWGSCIPVWECDTCGEFQSVGSLDELEAASGQRPDDLHKHFVDPITWPCVQPACSGTMVRVPEVLDCWFESGSMPYAQLHYPFENQELFESTYPAQFIAEGLDQTRGWFYTLHVLAAALFDQPSFQNCVVNGMILAGDGRKMSKSLKNYPDPLEILDEFGADALRAYLINSPVLRAEPLRFSKDGVRDVVRTVLLPLWNSYSFFTTYAEADGITVEDLDAAPAAADRPEIDRWILSVLQSLVGDVNREMEGYYLYSVIPPTLGFIDDLTNWYVRRSRRRFWRARAEDERDKLAAFATLRDVLRTFVQVLAPVLPFIAEEIYQGLVVDHAEPETVPASVHHTDFPQADTSVIDVELEQAMATVRSVVTLGRGIRAREQTGVRQPLEELTVLTRDQRVDAAVTSHVALIIDELNVRNVVVRADEASLVRLSAKANFKTLGPRLGPLVKDVAAGLSKLESQELDTFLAEGSMTIAGHELTGEDVIITREPIEGLAVASDGPLSVALEMTLTPELLGEGQAREFVNRLQGVRRDLDLAVTDRVRIVWHTDDDDLARAINTHAGFIAGEVLAVEWGQEPGIAGTAVRVG